MTNALPTDAEYRAMAERRLKIRELIQKAEKFGRIGARYPAPSRPS